MLGLLAGRNRAGKNKQGCFLLKKKEPKSSECLPKLIQDIIKYPHTILRT